MPEISRFFGIVIQMYFNEHNPPHFHAEYQNYEAVICINDLRIVAGYLPPRPLALVLKWTELHRKELLENWSEMRLEHSPKKIKPLE